MNEDEALRALARVCGLSLGLVLGLAASWAPAAVDYVSMTLCMSAVAEAGRDGRAECVPEPFLITETPASAPALWATLVKRGD